MPLLARNIYNWLISDSVTLMAHCLYAVCAQMVKDHAISTQWKVLELMLACTAECRPIPADIGPRAFSVSDVLIVSQLPASIFACVMSVCVCRHQHS